MSALNNLKFAVGGRSARVIALSLAVPVLALAAISGPNEDSVRHTTTGVVGATTPVSSAPADDDDLTWGQ